MQQNRRTGFGALLTRGWRLWSGSLGTSFPAVLLCGVGILAWTATTGFFDIFSYGFKSLLVLFSPMKHPDDHMHYADYKAMKELKRGKTIRFILYVGLVFLGVAGLFLAVYYSG